MILRCAGGVSKVVKIIDRGDVSSSWIPLLVALMMQSRKMCSSCVDVSGKVEGETQYVLGRYETRENRIEAERLTS